MNFVTGLLVLCRISQDYATGGVFMAGAGGLYSFIGSASSRLARPLLPCTDPEVRKQHTDFTDMPLVGIAGQHNSFVVADLGNPRNCQKSTLCLFGVQACKAQHISCH
jgi:hypothetical protein